jgi:hypothetical protein
LKEYTLAELEEPKENTPLLAEISTMSPATALERLAGERGDGTDGDMYLGHDSALEAANSAECTSQFEALTRILAGENIFMTGGPGTGKSSVVHLACRLFDMHGIQYEVTAPTGAAAENIGGCTIHSLFGIDKRKHVDDVTGYVSYLFHKSKRLKEIDVLIIDEVSMVYGQLWQELEERLRHIRGNSLPYGGVQIIAAGDFNQLKAVPDRDFGTQEHYKGFPFGTPAWESANFRYCYLTTAHRATDPVLARIINHMSNNSLTTEDFNALSSRTITKERAEEMDKSTDGEPTIRIYARNREVEEHNAVRIKELPGKAVKFTSSANSLTPVESLTPTQAAQWKALRSRSEMQTSLKIDAKVVADMPTEGWFIYGKNSAENSIKISNGTMGYVRGFARPESDDRSVDEIYRSSDDIPEGEKVYPIVEFMGEEFMIPYVSTVLERPVQITEKMWDSQPFASARLFPLKAGYAVTTHKSQGQTYDGAVLDLSSAFVEGLGYVALSRVRKLDTAYILGSNNTSWKVDVESVKIMQAIRAWASEDTKAFRENVSNYEEAYRAFVIMGTRNQADLSDIPPRIMPSDVEATATASTVATTVNSQQNLAGLSRDTLRKAWSVVTRFTPLYAGTELEESFNQRLQEIKATGDAELLVSLMVDMLDGHGKLINL